MDPVFHPAIATILAGDLDGLRALLAADPELVRGRSSCGHPTLLQLVACEASKLPDALGSAAVLVEAGAPLAEPLVAAASVDARQVLLFLLEQGIGVDGEGEWTPLDEAIYWRHLELAQVLLDRGAQIRSLRAAAGLGQPGSVDRFFADGALRSDAGPIRSPFADTVPPERANTPQDILDNAFVMAVHNGWQQVAATLLDRGARLNGKPPGFHWRGTALHAAVWRGDRAMVDWLLARGADPTVRDDMVGIGGDAVGWAEHHGHPDLASLLRRHGAGQPGSE